MKTKISDMFSHRRLEMPKSRVNSLIRRFGQRWGKDLNLCRAMSEMGHVYTHLVTFETTSNGKSRKISDPLQEFDMGAVTPALWP